MKNVARFSLVLMFAVAGWAQAGKAECPRISVAGTMGSAVGAPIPYTLSIAGEPQGSALEIEWTASKGKVIRGSDARQIKVVDWDYKNGLTVTAQVKGLPAGCPNIVSELAVYDPPPEAVLADQYGPAVFATVKEYLLNSAAKDFHEHQPPYPAKFRKVRIGHLGDPLKTGYYRLCGEFLPTETGKAEWTKFATIKTSGYEQYLGPTQYCTDKKITWDTKTDLAPDLKAKLDSLKK